MVLNSLKNFQIYLILTLRYLHLYGSILSGKVNIIVNFRNNWQLGPSSSNYTYLSQWTNIFRTYFVFSMHVRKYEGFILNLPPGMI